MQRRCILVVQLDQDGIDMHANDIAEMTSTVEAAIVKSRTLSENRVVRVPKYAVRPLAACLAAGVKCVRCSAIANKGKMTRGAATMGSKNLFAHREVSDAWLSPSNDSTLPTSSSSCLSCVPRVRRATGTLVSVRWGSSPMRTTTRSWTPPSL
jgi:hypothetical protein